MNSKDAPMKHPFQAISQQALVPTVIAFIAAALAVMISLRVLDEPLKTDAAPQGIVSYELAGNANASLAVLESWDQPAKLYAAFSLGLDFLFLITYSSAIALACIWATGLMPGSLTGLGIALAWGQWVAAILDGLENTALFIMLTQGPSSPWPQIAQIAAITKFTLILLGLLYVIGRIVERYVKRSRNPEV
jgi:hypothetical protein